MSEKTFEKQLEQSIKNSVLETVKKTDFIQQSYETRKRLPDEFIEKVWGEVDWNEVIERVKPEIHTQICNSIIGSMGAEIKTDVKSILSIDGVRQKLRVTVYPEIMKILNDK